MRRVDGCCELNAANQSPRTRARAQIEARNSTLFLTTLQTLLARHIAAAAAHSALINVTVAFAFQLPRRQRSRHRHRSHARKHRRRHLRPADAHRQRAANLLPYAEAVPLPVRRTKHIMLTKPLWAWP